MVNRHSVSGFTLLETLIAMAIMMVSFASILMVESASINTSRKAKQMNVVGMLAKQAMLDAEDAFQGKTFSEVKKEASGEFKEPYQEYSWTRTIKEVQFPRIALGGGNSTGSATENTSSGQDSQQTQALDSMIRIVTTNLSKAIREVNVTIKWKKGEGHQTYSLSTYWVNLNHEFQLSE